MKRIDTEDVFANNKFYKDMRRNGELLFGSCENSKGGYTNFYSYNGYVYIVEFECEYAEYDMTINVKAIWETGYKFLNED